MTQKLQVVHEAKCLLKDLSKNENVIRAGFGAVVLNRINGRVGPPPAAIHATTWSGIELIRHLKADGRTNLEQPTLNHVQSDTMASAVLADPPRALQGTNRGSRPAMEESENDVGGLEQLLLYADEHYLAGKLPLGDHLGKVLHGVKEYHQRNVGSL
ncbi:15-hydroxyprostaglandin dehydrogenase [Trichonephila clavipes]|uniref:15-hydroxyprostaglandin dehydrogenase n=1 Tax=Trichonephila clavipes TaxID=2585209 RepID=A0A8X6VI59_TRICX|nr:15-hydroxyprostaglandin dehydrogenase [Trichonephila clavipes]